MSDKNKKKGNKSKLRKRKSTDPIIKHVNPDTGEDLSHDYMDSIDLVGDHTTKSRLKAAWREFNSPGGLGYDISQNTKEMGPKALDFVQDKADYAGMAPLVGNVVDLPNAGLSLLRGDMEEAAWRASAAIPVAGLASKPAKVASKSNTIKNLVTKHTRAKGYVRNRPKTHTGKYTPKHKPKANPKAAEEVTEKVTKEVAEEAAKKGRLERLKEWPGKAGRGLLPKNWSTTTKIGAGVGALAALYRQIGKTNVGTEGTDSSEVPENEIPRFNFAPKESKEMGGIIQHEGGTETPVGNGLTEYTGRTHEQGGIIDGNSEVETGETKINDYIFSDTLQHGGQAFSDVSKNIVQEGGGEAELHSLARMQETLAANKGMENRDPAHADEAFGVKKYGGLQNLPKFNDGGNKNLGKKGVASNQTNVGGGYYASDDAKMVSEEAEKEDFYNRNKDVLNSLGINSWQDYNPEKHASMFQSKVNAHLKNKFEGDEELRNKLEQDGVSSAEDYIKSQGFGGEGFQAEDGKHGEYHNSITTQGEEEPADPGEEVDETVVEEEIEEKEKKTKKDSTLVDAAQFLPSMMAMGDKPNYMDTPGRVNAGIVVSSDIGHQNLDRVSMNADKSRLNNNLNTMIGRGSNLSTAEKSALLLSANKGISELSSQEIAANAAISNTEAGINSNIDATNASNALDASKTNASNILTADNANVKNAMYKNEFNVGADAATFDRKLDAAQFTTNALADIYKSRLKYDADEVETRSISGESGVADRKLDFGKYGGLKKKKKR